MIPIKKRLTFLREVMIEESVQACIVPSEDPHFTEYPPAHWEIRKWLSGFMGSAGTLVVTDSEAGLWTDSRYFLQAEMELKGSGIQLFKDGLLGTITPVQWLSEKLTAGDSVGIDGSVFNISAVWEMKKMLGEKGVNLNASFSPYDKIWENRPSEPQSKAFVFLEQFSGESTASKIKRVLAEIKKQGGDALVLSSLDSIAWLFNLRGNDTANSPLLQAHAIVSEKETVLFIRPQKINAEIIDYLSQQGVIFADYERITYYLKRISPQTKFIIAPAKINYQLYETIPASCPKIMIEKEIVDELKSVKNKTEIDGFRCAMKRDGVALVQFFIWLEEALKNGENVNELTVVEKLSDFRSKQECYFSDSFDTIAGFGAHGAIVHYHPTEESCIPILKDGILLIDSGAQYFDGTTDITRTLAIGDVSKEMKTDYTLVLKGHIQLACAKFPKGTIGMQLDVLARQFLWQKGANYLHGTGHGIGHFLNVHEGPQSIRMNYNSTALLPGMITSNEPGLYKAGKYGIRIENLILTVLDSTTEWGEFYTFETLTLCPIDTRLIELSLLTESEIDWLNTYHQRVYDTLEGALSSKEKAWLQSKTQALRSSSFEL